MVSHINLCVLNISFILNKLFQTDINLGVGLFLMKYLLGQSSLFSSCLINSQMDKYCNKLLNELYHKLIPVDSYVKLQGCWYIKNSGPKSNSEKKLYFCFLTQVTFYPQNKSFIQVGSSVAKVADIYSTGIEPDVWPYQSPSVSLGVKKKCVEIKSDLLSFFSQDLLRFFICDKSCL